MKCLWVEDFNHKQPTVEEEKQWREKYNLPYEEVVLKTTLTGGLAYIDEIDREGDDYDKIDTVILDINLECGDPVDGKSYKDYLKGNVTACKNL